MQWAETAIFITVDEGGGFYDSGFIQPVDFSSFVKFIERNWMLDTTLSFRSRDNLANPIQEDDEYVPHNMPAIGDLFDLFNFHSHSGHDSR